MNENGNEKMLFAAFCSPLLVLVFGAFSISKTKTATALVARYGCLLLVMVFCSCFHLKIALLVLDFVGAKNRNEQQKAKSPNGNQA